MSMLSRSVVRGLLLSMAIGAVVLGTGCDDPESNKASTTQPIIRYQSEALRKVPDYLKDTIYEKTRLQDTKPFLYSGYGLVTYLRQTGDNSAIPTPVRDYMVQDMLRHGFGTHRVPGFENFSPEKILRDKTTAVVQVDGFVPPGARKGDHFDAMVSALAESYTGSLSHGVLYLADLKYLGANPYNPRSQVNVYAVAEGPIVVNPAYALTNPRDLDATGKASLRYGVIMNGGVSNYDRPLTLRIREPQFSTAKLIERCINQRFQDEADKINQLGNPAMAAAQDEAIINIYVPGSYHGDWERFAGVVQHLYLNSSPGYLALQAEKLAAAAVQPGAPLENISYALEGIGKPAQGVLSKLMKNSSADVQYAAVRAAAFIGDDSGEARDLLLQIARTPEHPYRLNAVKVLGEMQGSLETAHYLRQLVNSDNTAVRIEAYKALANQKDHSIYEKVVQEKFILDLVPSSGEPMIYISRRGTPRIAVFGRQSMPTPLMFSAINARLTITADKAGDPLTVFYRSDRSQGDLTDGVIRRLCRADLAEVIATLGGEASSEESKFDFSYSDIMALLQDMSKQNKLIGTTLDGKQVNVLVNIEEQTAQIPDQTSDAPRIPDMGRQQGEPDSTSVPKIPDTQGSEKKDQKPAAPGGRQN